jgi:hypothetical protein
MKNGQAERLFAGATSGPTNATSASGADRQISRDQPTHQPSFEFLYVAGDSQDTDNRGFAQKVLEPVSVAVSEPRAVATGPKLNLKSWAFFRLT